MIDSPATSTSPSVAALAEQFPGRNRHGYVVGFYVYSGYTAATQHLEAGPLPTFAEAQEFAGETPEGKVVCGLVFTATGSIIKDRKVRAAFDSTTAEEQA